MERLIGTGGVCSTNLWDGPCLTKRLAFEIMVMGDTSTLFWLLDFKVVRHGVQINVFGCYLVF